MRRLGWRATLPRSALLTAVPTPTEREPSTKAAGRTRNVIFSQVAAQNGGHSDGALYWKAYAQNKLGKMKAALDTCAELGRSFASSSWIHECGALDI